MGDWQKRVLGKLILFLRLVSVSAEKNLMTSGNIGVVFGPTLMKEEKRYSKTAHYNNTTNKFSLFFFCSEIISLDMLSTISSEIIEFLIDESPNIWPI